DEYYQNQVAQYLTANMPGVSLADLSHDGPIHPQTITALPINLPYSTIGTPTTSTSIPASMEHQVQLTLVQGSTILFQKVLIVPQVSLERVTIDYTNAGNGNVTPQLMLDGQLVATGPAVPSGTLLVLNLQQYDPGIANQSTNFPLFAGQFTAVGLDAGQIS